MGAKTPKQISCNWNKRQRNILAYRDGEGLANQERISLVIASRTDRST